MTAKLQLPLILLCLLFTLKVQAQTEDTIRFQILKDSPHTIPKTTIKLTPVSMNVSMLNIFAIGYEVGFKTSLFRDKLSLGANYFSCLPNGLYDYNYKNSDGFNNGSAVHIGSSVTQAAKQSLVPTSSIDAHIGYTIKDETKGVKLNLAIKSSYITSNLIQVVYITPTANLRRLIKINGGVKSYSTQVNIFNSNSISSGQDDYILANDGTKFYDSGISYADIDYEKYKNQFDPEYYKSNTGGLGWVTQMKVNALYLGISRTKIFNYLIDTKYGKRGKESSNTFYFDAFYAPSISIDPITYFASNSEVTPDPYTNYVPTDAYIGTSKKKFFVDGGKSKSVQFTPYGFRLGFEAHAVNPLKIFKWANAEFEENKIFTLGYKWEVGMLPSLKNKGFYSQLSIFFPFNI